MKTRAAVAFIIFLVILMLPFIINASGGRMFQGSGGPGCAAALAQYNQPQALDCSVAASAQYRQTPPLPDMFDHMNHFDAFIQEGLTPKNCLLCHTDRANFCDKCHGYVGANPSIS